MKIVSRESYHQAAGRHKLLWRCLYGFLFLQIAYGLLFGWSRTGSVGVYHFFLGVGNVAGDMLAPLIPAIDNVTRDYHADGYGHRAEFARHVAAVGWLLAVSGALVFSPLLVKDHKFIKKQWRAAVRARMWSCELHLLCGFACVVASFYVIHLLFDGAWYDGDGRYRVIGRMTAIRRYDFAAGGAVPFPFLAMFFITIVFIQLWHTIRMMLFSGGSSVNPPS